MRIRPVALALCLAAFVCRVAIAEPARIELKAEATLVSGKVEVLRQDKWSAVAKGDMLKAGDSVRTGADGECELTWNGKIARVRPLTEVKITEMSVAPAVDLDRTLLDIKKGTIYAKVNKLRGAGSSFQVKSPTAVAGVRGTGLIANAQESGASEFICVQGEISVKGNTGDEVIVGAGMSSSVDAAGVAGAAKKADAAEIKMFNTTKGVGSPALQIIKPAGNMDVKEGGALVHGKTDAGSSVTVNGEKTVVTDEGFFTTIVYLSEGVNKINVSSANTEGTSSSRVIEIGYKTKKTGGASGSASESSGDEDEDGLAPGSNLSISAPTEKFLTRKETVLVTGLKAEGSKLTVNGSDVGVEESSRGFMTNVDLPEEGENIVTVEAAKDGTTTKAVLKVTRDTTPPMLEIINPSDGGFDITTGDCDRLDESMSECSLVGFTEAGATLIVNDISYQVEDDGTFNQKVLLNHRNAVLVVSAQDQAGNRTTKVLTRTLRAATEAYYMTITVNPSLIASNGASAVVTVTGKDYIGQELTGSVVKVTATPGVVLSSDSVTLVGGTGTLTVSADPNYVMTSDTLTVTLTAASVDTTKSATLTINDLPCDLDDLDNWNGVGNCVRGNKTK